MLWHGRPCVCLSKGSAKWRANHRVGFRPGDARSSARQGCCIGALPSNSSRRMRCNSPSPMPASIWFHAAFGFRNLANYERGLSEILRVLKPGGAAAILEFAEPPGRVFSALYRFYFRNVLPRLGGMISGNASAYSYLPSSVSKFPPPEELKSDLERAGFVEVRFERWTGGIVTLHTAHKARSTLNLSFRA